MPYGGEHRASHGRGACGTRVAGAEGLSCVRYRAMYRIWWAVGFVLASGCGQADPIRSYRVAKPPSVAEANHVEPSKDRMLGAIIPRGPVAWFFKVTGSEKAVGGIADAFGGLIESVRFPEPKEAPPSWNLPSGWRQQGASGIRFATIQVDSGVAPLEITVTSLPIQGELDAYVLANVNRWRDQLGLPAMGADALSDQSRAIALEDATATVVDFVGTGRAAASSRPPFASQAPGPEDGVRPLISFSHVPAGWKPGKLESARGGITVRYQAAFDVQAEGQRVEITVMDLPGVAADPLLNVNRWRGLIGLGPVTQQALDEQLREFPIGQVMGHYIEIVGRDDAPRPESILAVIAPHQGKAWFFRLKGDAKLAEREKERFESFVRSAMFSN